MAVKGEQARRQQLDLKIPLHAQRILLGLSEVNEYFTNSAQVFICDEKKEGGGEHQQENDFPMLEYSTVGDTYFNDDHSDKALMYSYTKKGITYLLVFNAKNSHVFFFVGFLLHLGSSHRQADRLRSPLHFSLKTFKGSLPGQAVLSNIMIAAFREPLMSFSETLYSSLNDFVDIYDAMEGKEEEEEEEEEEEDSFFENSNSLDKLQIFRRQDLQNIPDLIDWSDSTEIPSIYSGQWIFVPLLR